MRKVLCMSLLLVQLAATAFAYTDKESGFKALSPRAIITLPQSAKAFTALLKTAALMQAMPKL